MATIHAEPPQPANRLQALLQRFRDDRLTVTEGHELLARLESALQRARAADDRRAILRFEFLHGGVESYLFLKNHPRPKP